MTSFSTKKLLRSTNFLNSILLGLGVGLIVPQRNHKRFYQYFIMHIILSTQTANFKSSLVFMTLQR